MVAELEREFNSIDLERIKKYVEEGTQEDLHLDFKIYSNLKKEQQNDPKRHFTKLASAFANSDGGIIVWGVDARKNQDGVDTAIEIKPFAEFLAWCSELQSLTGKATVPIIDGIQHKPIAADSNSESGFVVSLVPVSESGPHMAMLAKEYRYYKRSGDSCYKLEHFDLEDMFGRRPAPRLKLLHELVPSGTVNGYQHIDPILRIVNDGRGLAQHICLTVKSTDGVTKARLGQQIQNFGWQMITEINSPVRTYRVFSTPGNVIHSSMAKPVLQFANVVIGWDKKPPEDIRFQYELYCDSARLQEGDYIIKGHEIVAAAPKTD